MPLLVTAELTATSGIAKDSAMLQFAIDNDVSSYPTPGNTLDLVGPINTFLNNMAGGISSKVSRAIGGVKYKIFDLAGHLDGSPHGSPIATDTGRLLNTASGTDLPSEVAIVFSLKAQGWDGAAVEAPDGSDAGSLPDRPRQRRSGRIYLGPLTTGVLVTSASGPRPDPAYTGGALTQLETMADALETAGYTLAVWSRTDAILRPVIAVSVDDAFDTQRRRGIAPTVRTVRNFA